MTIIFTICIHTVMTTRAVNAPDRTIDFGWRMAISAAMINVSSPIWQQHQSTTLTLDQATLQTQANHILGAQTSLTMIIEKLAKKASTIPRPPSSESPITSVFLILDSLSPFPFAASSLGRTICSKNLIIKLKQSAHKCTLKMQQIRNIDATKNNLFHPAYGTPFLFFFNKINNWSNSG